MVSAIRPVADAPRIAAAGELAGSCQIVEVMRVAQQQGVA